MTTDGAEAVAPPAAIGFRARTGRAVAVLVAGSSKAPRALKRHEISLTSPTHPETKQPFHAVMELPLPEALAAAGRTEEVIVSVARGALGMLLEEAGAAGVRVRAIGVVGSPDRDLSGIGNPHIRAHAAEGILFRRVLETAAVRSGLSILSLAETGLEGRAASELGLSPSSFRARLSSFGEDIGRPWRADEKAASTAAWLALAR